MTLDFVFRLIAALLGASGIAAAAFGSHGLEKFTDAQGIRWWAIGAAIQLVTAPVLLFCSRALKDQELLPVTPFFFLVGVLLFSGSLYAMALGAPRFLGAVTPLGGLCLILGWLCVAWPQR